MKHSKGTIRNLWNTIGRRFNAFPRCPKRFPAWASGESSANMKIRCGSHQQNRSIVRPGLSLMAAKVALTAEEFRENSQRSIALFNTEKLSTNSTHVLKSAYCNSVHFCRCNLHGACGGKALRTPEDRRRCAVAICTGRVEAKVHFNFIRTIDKTLQSARSVWRQRLEP